MEVKRAGLKEIGKLIDSVDVVMKQFKFQPFFEVIIFHILSILFMHEDLIKFFLYIKERKPHVSILWTTDCSSGQYGKVISFPIYLNPEVKGNSDEIFMKITELYLKIGQVSNLYKL